MATRAGGCIRVVLLLLLAPILFGLGLWFVSNLERVATHDTTTGVVVDLISSRDSDGDLTYAPVYEYQVDGVAYIHESSVSYGGILVPDIGDTRTILYDPDNPNDSRIRNIFLLIWLPLILMAIPLLIAAAIFWSMRRRRRFEEQAPPWSQQYPQPPPQWGAPQPTGVAQPVANRSTIEATFMGTEPSRMDEQRTVRYRVKARAEIDGVMHRFRGPWLDEDPTLFYMEQGNKVEVEIDPNDPSSYEVIGPTEE